MAAVEMVVADDSEPEPERSAAVRIAVEFSDSAAWMMLCDDDVVPVNFFDIRELCAIQEGKSMCSDGDTSDIVLGPPAECIGERQGDRILLSVAV